MPPLLRRGARAASANVNAPRTRDGPRGVAGPGESAGDAGPKAKARVPAVGPGSSSRRWRTSEGVNTGAAGLSRVFVVLVSNAPAGAAPESPSSDAFCARDEGEGDVVVWSGMVVPPRRRIRRALFITYVAIA
jgi:hypothetical protein